MAMPQTFEDFEKVVAHFNRPDDNMWGTAMRYSRVYDFLTCYLDPFMTQDDLPAIPGRGNVDFIDEIRLTVAGTAGGTVVDCAKLGLGALAVGTVGDDEKAGWVLATMAGFGIDVSGMQRLRAR